MAGQGSQGSWSQLSDSTLQEGITLVSKDRDRQCSCTFHCISRCLSIGIGDAIGRITNLRLPPLARGSRAPQRHPFYFACWAFRVNCSQESENDFADTLGHSFIDSTRLGGSRTQFHARSPSCEVVFEQSALTARFCIVTRKCCGFKRLTDIFPAFWQPQLVCRATAEPEDTRLFAMPIENSAAA